MIDAPPPHASAPVAKRFRPEFWPSLITAIAFLTIAGLGIWQLERLEWKRGILQQIEQNLTTEPQPLPAPIEDAQALRYRFVSLTGQFLHDKELHQAGKYHKGQLGYHLLTPLRLSDGRVVMVNRGWVPKEQRDADSRPGTQPEGQVTVLGIVRLTNRRNIFIPDNDAVQNQWFWYELPAMQAAVGAPLQPVVIEQVRSEGEQGLPIAAEKKVEIRNDHLMYALTWFGLAAAVLVIYLIYSMKPQNQQRDQGET